LIKPVDLAVIEVLLAGLVSVSPPEAFLGRLMGILGFRQQNRHKGALSGNERPLFQRLH
jgi:hypothetical protein